MKNRFRYISLLLLRHRQVRNSCGSLHTWSSSSPVECEASNSSGICEGYSVNDRKMYFSPRIFIHFQQDERNDTNNLIISLPRISIR